jgi:hypothetical protein
VACTSSDCRAAASPPAVASSSPVRRHTDDAIVRLA